jgi:RNase P subunit RPR2
VDSAIEDLEVNIVAGVLEKRQMRNVTCEACGTLLQLTAEILAKAAVDDASPFTCGVCGALQECCYVAAGGGDHLVHATVGSILPVLVTSGSVIEAAAGSDEQGMDQIHCDHCELPMVLGDDILNRLGNGETVKFRCPNCSAGQEAAFTVAGENHAHLLIYTIEEPFVEPTAAA